MKKLKLLAFLLPLFPWELLVLIVPFMPSCKAGILYTDYSQHRPQDAIAKLQAQQVDYPNDPEINYNLGVAQYRAKKYADAQENFKRTANDTPDQDFQAQARFNLGNSLYQHAASLLPKNWEDKDSKVKPEVLQTSTQQAQAAIDAYKKVLEHSQNDDKSQTNKKKAEELLKKLQKKQQQQQQKQDKKNKDNKKDQQNKQDQKNQNQDNKDQQKQDKSQQDKDKNNNQQSKQDQKKNSQDQQEGQKQPNSKKSPEKQEKGEEDEPDKKNSDSNQQQDADHDKEASQQDHKNKEQPTPEHDSRDENKQAEQGVTGKENNQPEESMERRGMRAVLQNLEQDESNAQKRFMMQKMKQAKPPLKSGQKPW